MKYLDLNMSISFEKEMLEEDMSELAEDIVSWILKQKNVKGVGYDHDTREAHKVEIPF